MTRRGRLASAWLAVTLVLAACGAPTRTPAPSGDVVVLADASLSGVFVEVARDFESWYPGVRVAFTFAGSADLAARVTAGAAGDVFAADATAPMQQLTGAGRAQGEPTAFARNRLVIAVPTGNPGHVASLADLARVRVALCVEREPCGESARTVLSSASVVVTPSAEGSDVKATLEHVLAGQVDAALVYRTDAAAAQAQVDTVEFIESVQAAATAQAVPLAGAANGQAAQAFVAYLTSERGRAVLDAAGFQEP